MLSKLQKLVPKPLGGWGRLGVLGYLGLPYVTPKKIINFLRCELEAWTREARPQAYPYSMVIDPTGYCNLHCAFCPTGAQRLSGRQKKALEVATVQQLLDEIGDYLISINLYNWGEPLLHPKIAQLVKIIHEYKIFTMLSTNLNYSGKSETLKELCRNGLDYLVVSLSGASQAVYERYHQKGKLDLLLNNVLKITDYKRKNNLITPVIEFHYLIFQYNRHEIESARKIAADLGVDILRALAASGPDDIIVPDRTEDPKHHFSKVNFCHQLWHLLVLNADGGIAPCYYLYFKKDDLGDYPLSNIREIRQNDKFFMARNFFNPKAADQLPNNYPHPCLKCKLVHKQHHLQNYLKINPYAKQDHRTGGP